MSSINCGTRAVLPGCSVLPPMEPIVTRPASVPTGKKTGNPKSNIETGNRFRDLNDFVDISMTGLSRAELGAWLVLYRDTKPDGLARTSMSDIARRVGLGRRRIVTAVGNLEKKGFLTVVVRGGMRRGMNTYRVNSLTTPQV